MNCLPDLRSFLAAHPRVEAVCTYETRTDISGGVTDLAQTFDITERVRNSRRNDSRRRIQRRAQEIVGRFRMARHVKIIYYASTTVMPGRITYFNSAVCWMACTQASSLIASISTRNQRFTMFSVYDVSCVPTIFARDPCQSELRKV